MCSYQGCVSRLVAMMMSFCWFSRVAINQLGYHTRIKIDKYVNFQVHSYSFRHFCGNKSEPLPNTLEFHTIMSWDKQNRYLSGRSKQETLNPTSRSSLLPLHTIQPPVCSYHAVALAYRLSIHQHSNILHLNFHAIDVRFVFPH